MRKTIQKEAMYPMKKPKCFLAHRIALLLLSLGVVLAALGVYFRSQDPGSLGTVVACLLILPVLAGVLIARTQIVCPHCGGQLFRGRYMRFRLPGHCPHC